MAADGASTHGRAEAETEFNRIVAFTDGVFAIAITLLVLGLEVPGGVDDLTDRLLDEGPSLFAYALSFAVLGRFWLIHHRFFGGLERFDGALMTLNLIYLAFIALVPFTSQVLGDYGGESAAVIVYAASMVGVTVTFGSQVVYAYRRNLLSPSFRDAARSGAAPGTFAATAIFGASIPIALVSPTVATLSWLLIAIGDPVGERIAAPLMGRTKR